MALVDSNILIYAHDSDSQFYAQSSAFLTRHIRKRDICLSLQTMTEAYRIWTQKIPKPISAREAWTIGDYYLQAGVPIIVPSGHAYTLLKELSLQHSITGVHIFDTLLVATMLEHDVSLLYTANIKDFVQFKEILVRNPLS